MTEETTGPNSNFIELAGDIVAAYVSNNPVPAAELPALIVRVHGAISGLVAGTPTAAGAAPQVEVEKPSAAQIRKSVRHDGIVSFIDGRSYQTLKRHLTAHGLTPERYRAKYGLPADYPMVAPGYAARRSEIARAIQLGHKAA